MKRILNHAAIPLISLCLLFASCNSNNNMSDTPNSPDLISVLEKAPELVINTTLESSAMQIVSDMGIGINLGNTFESADSGIGNEGGWVVTTVNGFETAWGSPTITEKIIKGYADAGFKTLRVPVAWTNLMSEDGEYTISNEYLTRVKQIVDWAIKYNMYVIVNEHWDYGWIEQTGDYNSETKKFKNEEEILKKYKSIWTTVANAFKDYGVQLVFESQNEELGNFRGEDGKTTIWNPYDSSDTEDKKLAYDFANKINQTFVNIVRGSGFNNAKRLLYISGINTDIVKTCDPLFKMPTDSAKKMAVSVHYYAPAPFALLEENVSWGKCTSNWGTDAEIKELEKSVSMMKTTFVDKGIPVIIGEYGCPRRFKNSSDVNQYKSNTDLFLSTVCEKFYKAGMCPVLWDIQTEGNDKEYTEKFNPYMLYNRNAPSVYETGLMNKLNQIVKNGR